MIQLLKKKKVMGRLLTKIGYPNIVFASNGEEGFEKFQSELPNIIFLVCFPTSSSLFFFFSNLFFFYSLHFVVGFIYASHGWWRVLC